MDCIKIADHPRWYAIRTKPRSEDRANDNLLAWRVETFNPKLKKRVRDKVTGKTTEVIRPLFPGYIFARFDASRMLHKVRYTRAVHSVVCFADAPAAMEDECISYIRSRAGSDDCVQLEDELKPGDEVVVESGLLKGVRGILSKRLRDAERIKILLPQVTYAASLSIESHAVGLAKAS